jgi:hypothetical protein
VEEEAAAAALAAEEAAAKLAEEEASAAVFAAGMMSFVWLTDIMAVMPPLPCICCRLLPKGTYCKVVIDFFKTLSHF